MLLSVDKLGLMAGDRQLLGEISFSLNGGDRLVVLGIAGAGKTLLLDALAGQVPRGCTPSGTVVLGADGKVATDLGRRVAQLGPRAERGFDPLRPAGEQGVSRHRTAVRTARPRRAVPGR